MANAMEMEDDGTADLGLLFGEEGDVMWIWVFQGQGKVDNKRKWKLQQIPLLNSLITDRTMIWNPFSLYEV